MRKQVIIFGTIISCTIIFLIFHNKIVLAIGLGCVTTIFSLLSLKEDSDEIERQEEIKKRKLALINEDLVKLVKTKAVILTNNLKNDDESFSFLEYDESNLNWLLSYNEKLEDIMENRINGKPDTFIEASCLIFALVENNYITTNYSDTDAQTGQIRNKLLNSINLDLAFKIAFEMISSPITYVEVSEGNWVRSPSKTVKITMPEGIIENYPLYDRILRSICKGEEISIMQLSNMLQLIYLYSRDCCNN